MESNKRRLLVTLIVVLSLMIFAEYGHAVTLLPWVRFGGTYQATAGIGTGSLTLNATVKEMDYNNLDVWKANVAGVETIFGARVVLSGAIRTGDYSFNGDPINPNDVTFSIVASDGYVYFTSVLDDSVFTQQGTNFVWMNQNLTANNPATLNLLNVTLGTNADGLHPSRYIDELSAYMGSTNVSGLKMQLFVPSSGNFTTNSSGAISYGLIDGLQSLNTPPVADAGLDKIITTEQVANTTIDGTVTDADGASTLTCRWTETDESGNVLRVLQDWTSVGIDGKCLLNLGGIIPPFELGIPHILNLEANDGEVTSSDNIILTINNTAPRADAGPDDNKTTEQAAASFTITGTATDFDGNALSCLWTVDGTPQGWTPAESGGACPLNISALALPIGPHTLTLTASDGLATSSDDMILTITNTPPIANAGENIPAITSDQIAGTTIQGTATDFDGDALSCRWMEGLTVLQDWTPGNSITVAAGSKVECPLSLGSLSLSFGSHTLTLEADDGHAISLNSMDLTIENSAPHAAPNGSGVYQINTPVTLTADVSDLDNDSLHYEWTDGTTVLCSGDIQPVGGTAELLDCVVSNLSLGMHSISLQVSDIYNLPETKSITVQIIDSTAPTIKPVANKYILWPPNHQMVDIAVAANASDNSGCPVTLNATVRSNEPEYGLGSGDRGPDWTQPVIDQATGIIYLQLRAERSGRGKGRIYTVTVTATDCSGNISTAKVKIRVPHDKDNEDRKREDKEERERDDRKDCGDREDRDD
ncbi:MAG: cadherin repeat domain-containing protein [Nitrospirae bacterium]|nr:cadherin repeat domain-containing protein [Nitrospirota bacterium]